MINNPMPKFKVFNPKNKDCLICAGLNRIYRTDSFQQELEIPAALGEGYCRRIIVKPSLEIFIYNGTLYEKMIMRGRQNSPQNWFIFCMGDPIQWLVEGKKQEYVVTDGENYMINGSQDSHLCTYNPGRFLGLSVQVGAEIITSLIQYMGKEQHTRTGVFQGGSGAYQRKNSATVRLILNEMINCRYLDHVKRIYLEGKIMELIAVYLDEAILENGALHSRTRLSSADIKSLHEARRVLDKNLASPPTIAKLAKLVCLNEFKLKTGFKELFGLSVHAYIIDKRLELVRVLMEAEKLKVSEAVLMAGYNDASHFAEKFRKKYGVNPSACVKRL